MGRPRKGNVERKGSRWYFRLWLRSKRRYVAPIPPRASGKPITEAYAKNYAADMADRYERRAWDPEAPVEQTALANAETVGEYGEAWLATLTNATRRGDTRIFRRYIAPVFGAQRLEAVTVHAVAAFVAALTRRASRRGGTLAPRTARNVYSVLQRLYAHAERGERVTRTPCRLLRNELPKIADKNPRARREWVRTPDEVRALVCDPRVPPDRRTFYAVLFLSGLRYSEAAALRWSDWLRDRAPLGAFIVERSRDAETGRDKPTKTDMPREVRS